MGQSISIVAGAALIALAILIVGHWEVIAPQAGGIGMVRLNKWTGSIDVCAIDPTTIKGNTISGAQLACKAND